MVPFNSNFPSPLRPRPMDQAVAKKTLQELIRREDLRNKICADCSNPNPQWASLRCVGYHSCLPALSHPPSHVSFAIFLCLQCAGTHRGFGVHVRYAHPDCSLTAPGIHHVHHPQLRTIGVDGYMAGRPDQTDDREPPPKSSPNRCFDETTQLGGNGPFLSFVESYAPADQGGYKSEMSPHEKYHCWAAAQYKSKVRKALLAQRSPV